MELYRPQTDTTTATTAITAGGSDGGGAGSAVGAGGGGGGGGGGESQDASTSRLLVDSGEGGKGGKGYGGGSSTGSSSELLDLAVGSLETCEMTEVCELLVGRWFAITYFTAITFYQVSEWVGSVSG